MIIGLTGGIGSGKSTIVKIFSNYKNIAVYIADVEAKKLMNSSSFIKEKLIYLFGNESYKEGKLNRDFISNIVFNDKNKLKELNAIVHPEVRNHFKNFVANNKNKTYIIYESAILFESKTNQFCDFVITVYLDLETRINRIVARDNTTKEKVLTRINNQWKEEKKLLQSNYIIYNKELEYSKVKVNKIHNILTKKKVFF
ncbi:dephospho-CoA kinase [Polaribacter porphyrae]|uniref:Dephospho-CoA kinase n=1 Tax=Polaribacter porphyrae TaxID=1137780 RepID=A0A2S7WLK2_9FLAO|nr:dephospho-CoA kinase [Polaribacter porphyrae]PQJ78495.1 dephospho-CoA kinase [Polaribacter porphyrae]